MVTQNSHLKCVKMCAFMFGSCYIHVSKFLGEHAMKKCCEEKHRTEVGHGEFNWKFRLNMWRSFASPIRAGTTNRPVTQWCDPSKAPPTNPLKYGTPQRYIFMGDQEWNPI